MEKLYETLQLYVQLDQYEPIKNTRAHYIIIVSEEIQYPLTFKCYRIDSRIYSNNSWLLTFTDRLKIIFN